MSFTRHMTNLIDWFYFEDVTTGMERDASVLVLGEKDYTAPFIELLEKRVRTVSRRLDESTYDYVIIPVLTKRVLKMFKGNLGTMYSSITGTWLKQGGSIMMGMQNALDIDRMSSGEKEADVIYMRWSKINELRSLLHEEHPESKEWMYYPVPELKMPLNFYTDERLPGPADETEKIALLVKENQFQEFAPSYYYIFQPDGTHRSRAKDYRKYLPLYLKYNSSRKPEYAIKTEIYRDDKGKCHVVKAGITPDANAHIDSLTDKAKEQRKANPTVDVLMAEETSHALGDFQLLSYQVYPYLEGKNLGKILADMIKDGVAPLKELAESVDMVIGAVDGTVNPANLDCLFDNVIMENGRPTLIDCEWVLPREVEVRFLQFRILYYWYLEYRDSMAYDDLFGFLRNFGFTKPECQELLDKEKEFQLFVHGDGQDSNVNAYYENKVTVHRFNELKGNLAVAENERTILSQETKEQKIALRKEREINRLTSVHVANLTKVIKTHERDIDTLIKEREYYKAHMGWTGKVSESINDAYTRRFPVGSRKRKLLSYVGQTFAHPIKMLPMFFTEEGKNLIRGDFNIGAFYSEYGKVSFEKTDKPLVSIVIPCYNQINYTYQCLVSIKQHTDFDKTPYEVIIADDVSTDATREIGFYADNLVIARNTENMGFLKNCNQAAAIARGQYIFFLNNDTKVNDGWLDSLVELIESDDSIGMVGSKLVYPDGRLQEAGGIIWSDGSGWNYGRLQDPDEPEYNYVKEVDYISGAAIMIRTDLWKEIGGFDERFAPAYYEDTDLAFEVRKHGKKVVFQPKSVITHFEGISNGTDTSDTSGLKHYQVVNQQKFKEKWAEELKQQSVNDGSPNPFAARERGQNSKYILVVDHYVPTWDKDAGSKLDYQYMQLFMKVGYRVKFLGDNFAHEEPYTSALQQMGIEVLYGNTMQSGIWDWIDRNKKFINIAYLNRPHIAAKYIDYICDNTDIKVIYFGHDLHSLRLMREYEIDHDEKTREDAEYWHNVEYGVMRKADASYFPSEVEAEIVRKEDPTINVKGITAYVYDEPAVLDEDYAHKQGLLFVGGFGHPPNKDGLLWFVNNILPKIKAQIPDIVLNVAGSKADEEVLALNERPDVNVLGFVSIEELDELYRKNKVVVVPLRYGAGVKGKVVEALHAGGAIVTTSCGAEGIPEAATALRIQDTEDGFAEEVINLYNNTYEVERMSHRAVEFIREFYSPEGAWNKIREDFETDYRK
ncbi:putative glycosyltransferase [Lachnospiraceae bacterium JC7]|nr:putative glycosyltransferase [Lachnospiraceae bacterium JC7]